MNKKFVRTKGGNCNACGYTITDSASAIYAVIDTLSPGGRVLELFQYHSRLSLPNFQTVEAREVGPVKPKYCQDVRGRLLRSDTYKPYVLPGNILTSMDGDTAEMISILQKTYSNWTPSARITAADILFQYDTGITEFLMQPENSLRGSGSRMLAEVYDFMNHLNNAVKMSATPLVVYSKMAADDYFEVRINNGKPLKVSSKNVQYYLEYGLDFLQAAVDLTKNRHLNWTLPNAYRFVARLFRIGYTVSHVRQVIHALFNGTLTRSKGSTGMKRLRNDLDSLLSGGNFLGMPRRI